MNLKKLYFEKNCLLENINSSSFNKKLQIIQSLKEGTFLEDLLLPNINEGDVEEIRNIGFAAESSVKQLKKYKNQMSDYYKFFQLILFT